MTPFRAAFAAELVKTGAARVVASKLTPESSNVRGYRYDPEAKSLFVTFKSGGTYRYDGVPSNVAKSLGRNKSAGKTINRLVKDKGYSYEKVSWEDRLPGGQADTKTPGQFDRGELAKGVKEEMKEHTNSKHIATEIVMDHLVKDPAYYEKMEKLEKKSAMHRLGRRAMLKNFRPKGNSRERFIASRSTKTAAASIYSYFSESTRWASKLAGVAKRQTTFAGLPIKVEHDPGDVRSGTSKDGKTWERTMFASYGYIPGTKGKAADGDAIDVYLAKDPTDGPVFEVTQLKKDDGSFDEHKYMVGWPDADAAKKAYLQHMPEWAFGSIKQVADSARDFASSLFQEAA